MQTAASGRRPDGILTALFFSAFLSALLLAGCTSPPGEILSVEEASGVARVGDALLIVDDGQPGVYFRYPLPPGPASLLPIQPSLLEKVRFARSGLALDLESIGVLADGRVVALSERLRALVDSGGVVAEYPGPLGEIVNRGLEGLAIKPLPDGSSRIAVLWEGGYMEWAELPPAWQGRPEADAMRPLLFIHDLRPGVRGITLKMEDASVVAELEVPVPEGREPLAQRFRAPDLVWHQWERQAGREDGFIVLLSSQSNEEKPQYLHRWLQRFTVEGKPVGEPFDLEQNLPVNLRGANWEGLDWYEPGETLVTVCEAGPGTHPAVMLIPLPPGW